VSLTNIFWCAGKIIRALTPGFFSDQAISLCFFHK
jgi:hypothetical protein